LEVGPDQEEDIGSEDDDGDNDTDLMSRLQRLFSRSVCVCTPHHEQKVSCTVSMSIFLVWWMFIKVDGGEKFQSVKHDIFSALFFAVIYLCLQ
jgi:hypothetical protein